MEPTTQQPLNGRLGDILNPADPGFPPWAEGYLAVRPLDGDYWLVLMKLIPLPSADGPGDRTRIAVATAAGVEEHWCYSDGVAGILEFAAWPQPPTKWTRHMRADGTFEYPDDGTLAQLDRTRLEAQRLADIADGGAHCRVCGCTDNAACNPPCWWVERDLCSRCAL